MDLGENTFDVSESNQYLAQKQAIDAKADRYSNQTVNDLCIGSAGYDVIDFQYPYVEGVTCMQEMRRKWMVICCIYYPAKHQTTTSNTSWGAARIYIP